MSDDEIIEYIDVKNRNAYTPIDFEDLSYVQINYVEMRRQAERIYDIGNNICSKLNGVIAAINKLAGLVGASVSLSVEDVNKINNKVNEITSFINSQIDRYEELNDEVSSRINDLNYLIDQLFDEDGSYVFVINEDGNRERKLYQDILKEKEKEEAAKIIKEKVEAAGFTYYPEMGTYSELSFDSVEDKMAAFDNFIYTKAMEAGFTDKEAKMAIVISRWETGNYSKEVKGSDMYNYILPSNNNICGAKGGSGKWANLAHDKNGFNIYDTIDQSAEHFTDFLQGGYFSQGLTSFTKMQPKYCPIDDPSDTKGVNSQWLGGCQSLYYQLFGEWVD